MEYTILGHPPNGPKLNLHFREFAYAGKFVMSNTGKSVVYDDGTVVGATAFSPDYDDDRIVRLRYVTVRDDRRGQGIGSRLLRYTADALESEYDTVTIAVNNPIAYRACYRAGFVFTGDETGIAEVVLRYEPRENRSRERYLDGLGRFRGRELPESHLDALECESLPPAIETPSPAVDNDSG